MTKLHLSDKQFGEIFGSIYMLLGFRTMLVVVARELPKMEQLVGVIVVFIMLAVVINLWRVGELIFAVGRKFGFSRGFFVAISVIGGLLNEYQIYTTRPN